MYVQLMEEERTTILNSAAYVSWVVKRWQKKNTQRAKELGGIEVLSQDV